MAVQTISTSLHEKDRLNPFLEPNNFKGLENKPSSEVVDIVGSIK